MADIPKIRIGHLQITDHLILGATMTKLAKGVETLEHSTIEPVCMTGWNSIGEALQEKEIDAAFILAPYAMELFYSGEAIKLVLFAHRDGSIIVGNNKANIKSIADFKGKTLLIPYHQSVHHMLIDTLLSENGLQSGLGKDVVFETVAPSQIPEMIEFDEDGEIGGYIVAEPWGSKVIKAGLGTQLALSREIWPGHPCCVVVFREDIIQKYPEAVQELTNSLVNSGKLLEEKPETAIKIASAFLKQESDVMQMVLDPAMKKLSTARLLPVAAELQRMQDYLTSTVSAMSDKIDLDKFIITDFAKKAGAS